MIVGLTGGIGSGKTMVAEMFSELGIPVYNSDTEAKKLMHTSRKLKTKVIALLGSDAFKGNQLDTRWVAGKVFKDKGLLKKMNAIVHPVVRAHFLAWADDQNSPYVIQENAIIFENRAQGDYDSIILVVAPLEVRVERVRNRDHSLTEGILERISNQMEDADKQELANYVIENVDRQATKARVLEIHNHLMENLH